MSMDRRDFLINAASGSALVLSYHFFVAKDNGDILELIEKDKKQQSDNIMLHIEGYKSNRLPLVTKTRYTTEDNAEPQEHITKGDGLIYKNKILTVDHIVSFYEIEQMTPYGPMSIPIDKISEKTYHNDIELEAVVKKSHPDDMAIFKLPKFFNKPDYEIELGNSDELKYLDDIILIGDPVDMGVNVRQGKISRAVHTIEIGDGFKFFETKGFNSDILPAPGDSSEAGITLDGKLIGFLNQRQFGALSHYTPINVYKPHL